MITRLTHVTLFVSNQADALKFYTERLGFKVHTDVEWEGMRWLTINPPDQKDLEIALFPGTSTESKTLVGKQAATDIFLTFESNNVDKDYEELKAKGVEFKDAPADEPWGRGVTFLDLYGNKLYLVQPKK